ARAASTCRPTPSAPAPGSRPSLLGGSRSSSTLASVRASSTENACGRGSSSMASVEEVAEVLLHRLGDVERERLDRVRRGHGGGGDEDASLDEGGARAG